MSANVGAKDIVTEGLVLYLDAANYKSYTSGSTVWGDLSLNSYSGSLINGPTFNSANGGNIQLDGVNDFIAFDTLNTSILNLTSSNGATLSCWLKINLLSRWTGVFNFSTLVGNEADIGWDINPSNVLRIWKNAQGPLTNSLLPYSNVWCQYVLVSNSSGTIFYVNESEFTTTPATGNIGFVNGRTLRFGDHWDNSVQGNCSIIQIYNRALSAQEILQNYNSTKARFGLT